MSSISLNGSSLSHIPEVLGGPLVPHLRSRRRSSMIRDATDGRDGLMDCDFGTLLRQFRRSAGLTQEALAERSQISVDAISALERRRRKTPHRDTVSLLAAGLELKSDQHQALVAAAEHERPRGVTGPVAGSSSPRQLPRRRPALSVDLPRSMRCRACCQQRPARLRSPYVRSSAAWAESARPRWLSDRSPSCRAISGRTGLR